MLGRCPRLTMNASPLALNTDAKGKSVPPHLPRFIQPLFETDNWETIPLPRELIIKFVA